MTQELKPEDSPVWVKVHCENCGNKYEFSFRTPDPAIVAGVKLAAREKRMREVAARMLGWADAFEAKGFGQVADVMRDEAAKLLEGMP